nr:cell wall anchor protein [Micromonospora sp. DSM 115978]
MIRPKSAFRRAAAITAGALIGLAGTVALATPASAHHPIVKGEAPCVDADGNWKVNWLVLNSERDLAGEIINIRNTPEGTSLTGFSEGSVLPPGSEGLRGEQSLGSDARRATLVVTVKWVRERNGNTQIIVQKNDRVEVKKPKELCEPPEPTTPPTTPPASPSPSPEPSETPEPTPSPSEPSAPELSVELTCDEMIFEFVNPQDGEEFTITLTPNTGEPQTVTVAPGTTETVTFPASEGLEVVPSIEDEEGEPIAWEQPEDCDTGGDGGGLPVTGAAAGGIAGGAALLLAIGGGLFFLARRRRVTFTA